MSLSKETEREMDKIDTQGYHKGTFNIPYIGRKMKMRKDRLHRDD